MKDINPQTEDSLQIPNRMKKIGKKPHMKLKKRKQMKNRQQTAKNKMIDLRSTMSIITLNLSGLNL